MNDETQQFVKLPPGESKIWGVSVRGVICLLVTITVCLMSFLGIEVKEPLYTALGLVIGFYFGQREKPANRANGGQG